MYFRDKLVTFILILLILAVTIFTVYFCLDVFGIITVPAKYSIASLFYSQIEVIATGGETIIDEIFPTNNIAKKDDVIDNESEDNNYVVDIENLTNNFEDNQNESQDENEVIDESIFYYDQLDQYGKIIYDELYRNIDKLKTGTYTAQFDTKFDELLHQENGSAVLNSAFQLAINSLTFDNPDLFYIDITKINLITEITTKPFSKVFRVSIGENGQNYLSEDFLDKNIDDEINKVEEIKNNIINSARESSDDIVDQIKYVHDYLIDTIEYDSENGRDVYNIYGAIVNKRAVCEGYARAFKSILDDMGIPCIIVCGVAQNSSGYTESHAWNYVKVNDIWYAIDVTWDDPVIIGNGRITRDIKYKYFLIGSNDFFKDHEEDGNIVGEYNFSYPTINQENY